MAQAKSGDFISNLGKIYTYYTGGFFGFVILLAILEQVGVPNKWIGYGFVFLTIAVHAVTGLLARDHMRVHGNLCQICAMHPGCEVVLGASSWSQLSDKLLFRKALGPVRGALDRHMDRTWNAAY